MNNIYDKTDMRYKYQTDVHFKNLVDYMESFIHKGDFTPSEVREASMMASIHYEMTSIRKMYIPSAGIEIALDVFHKAVDEELTNSAKSRSNSYETDDS